MDLIRYFCWRRNVHKSFFSTKYIFLEYKKIINLFQIRNCNFSGVRYKLRELLEKDKVNVQSSVLGPILAIGVVGFVAAPLLLAVMSVIMGLDPLCFLIQEYLPLSDNRRWVGFWTFLLRLGVHVFYYLELSRWGTFLLIWMVIINFTGAAVVKVLHKLSHKNCVPLFTEFRILFVATCSGCIEDENFYEYLY